MDNKTLSPEEIAALREELAQNPELGQSETTTQATFSEPEYDLTGINPDEFPAIDAKQLEQSIEDYKTYGNRPIETFLRSGLSSATFSGSDWLSRAAGENPEEIRKLLDENPTAATVGTVTGIVGPALATGGTSIVAQAVSAPVKATMAAGKLAGSAATKALAPKTAALVAQNAAKIPLTTAARSTAAKLAGTAASEATQGALYGAAELSSDIANERRELSAESVMATVGTGAAWGGALGLGIPLLGKTTKTGYNTGKEFVKDKFGNIIDTNTIISRGVAKTPTQAANLIDDLGREVDSLPSFIENKLNFSYLDNNNTLFNKATKLEQTVGKEIGDLIGAIDTKTTEMGVTVFNKQKFWDPILKKFDELAENPNLTRAEREALEAERTLAINKASIAEEKLTKLTDAEVRTARELKEVSTIIKNSPNGAKLEAQRQNLVNQVQKIAERRQNALETMSRLGDDNIKRKVTLSQKIKTLEKQQVKLSRQIKEISKANEEYIQLLGRKAQLQDGLAKITKIKINSRGVDAPLSLKELDDYRKHLGGITYPFGGDESMRYKAQLAKQIYGVVRNQIDEVAARVDVVMPDVARRLKDANKTYHITKKLLPYLEDAVRTAPDILTINPVNWYNTAVSAGDRIARNIAIKQFVGESTIKLRQMMIQGVKAALSPAIKPSARVAATKLLLETQFARDEDGKKPKTKQQAFKNLQRNVSEIVSNPDKMVDLLAKRTSAFVQSDAQIGLVLQQRMVTALQFLHSKMPKSSMPPNLFAKEYEPSSMELGKFERYLTVIQQPISVFEELKAGTLTREHVEALQVVYPEIYNEIRNEVVKQISETKQSLSYTKKLQLGILLNVASDSSLRPESVMQLQASIAQQQPQQPQQGPQFRPSGVEASKAVQRLQTEVEKIESK